MTIGTFNIKAYKMANKHVSDQSFDAERASVIIRNRGFFSFYNNINRTVKYTCLFALAGIGLGVIAVGVLFFTGGLAAIGIVFAFAITLGAGFLGAISGWVVAKVSEDGPLTFEDDRASVIDCEEVPISFGLPTASSKVNAGSRDIHIPDGDLHESDNHLSVSHNRLSL